MSHDIDTIANFKKEAKRLIKKFPSLKGEIAELGKQLIINPKLGTPIGNDSYKIRPSIESKSKGKSGGGRVITYTLTEKNLVFLLSIYDESEQSNIADKELLQLLKEIK